MLKVGFNTYPLNSGHKKRGIGFYTANLLRELRKNKEMEVVEFDGTVSLQKVDVVHYPYFDLFKYSLPIIKKSPTVVTIHDIIPLLFPEHYPIGIKGRIYNFLQKVSLGNVKAIITDSLSSKKDITAYLGIDPDKVFPIYLAPPTHFKKIDNSKSLTPIKEKYQLPKQFVLFIGSVNWNKNLINMAKACCEAEVDLVMVGGGFETKDNLDHPELYSYAEFLKQFDNHPRIHILGYIPPQDLVAVVNLAKIVLYPSLYEGFGLPILEAQACGVPVITSNISSMPEIAGEGAMLVDPIKVEDIKQAIKNVLENPKLAQELVIKGSDNIKRFSWSNTALQTIKVYQYASSRI